MRRSARTRSSRWREIPCSHPTPRRRSSGIRKICRRFIGKFIKYYSLTVISPFCLTGAVTQELSQGYGLHCFDMREGRWDEEMCGRLGIPMEFPSGDRFLRHSGGNRHREGGGRERAAGRESPVVAGGLDAACGTLGSWCDPSG